MSSRRGQYMYKMYVRICGLLILVDNTPITRFEFQSILHRNLDFLQVPDYYTSQSLSIGMATELAKQRVFVYQIKARGK